VLRRADGVVVLTEAGRRKLDAAVAELVDQAMEATADIDAGHLAVLRDTCWRVTAAIAGERNS
jgi:hypothetical protein